VSRIPLQQNISQRDDPGTNASPEADMSYSGPCHFWRLSGELRNEIYEYALTAEDGTDIKVYEKDVLEVYSNSDGKRSSRPLNQLKYVCRQLQQETTGLELRLNVLCSTTTRDSRLSPPIMQFLRTRSRMELAMIRKVTVNNKALGGKIFPVSSLADNCLKAQKFRTGQDKASRGQVYSLYKFCEAYPGAEVVVRLDQFCLHSPKTDRCNSKHCQPSHNGLRMMEVVIFHIIIMQSIFPSPGKKLTSLSSREQGLLDSNAFNISRLTQKCAGGPKQLDNPRYFPSVSFYEDDIRYEMTSSGEYSKDRIEEIVGWLKELYETGI